MNDADFGLNGGLFSDGYESAYRRNHGHVAGRDFREFAQCIGIQEKRVDKLLLPFAQKQDLVEALIENSYLLAAQKKAYVLNYNRKRKFLSH